MIFLFPRVFNGREVLMVFRMHLTNGSCSVKIPKSSFAGENIYMGAGVGGKKQN